MDEEEKGESNRIFQALTEQDFIQQLSIDCVIIGYKDQRLKVLVPKLKMRGGFWVLPSGFILQEEGIDQAARRILENRIGIKNFYLEQFRSFGDKGRTNKPYFERMIKLNREKFELSSDWQWITRRFISIGYLALVDMNKVKPKKTEIDQSIEWFDVQDLPNMIMDHNQIVRKALDALRINFEEKHLASYLLPEKFTMKEIQQVYMAVFEKVFSRNNFQKRILAMEVLERLDKKYTGGAHKAPYLYRFKSNKDGES